MVFLSVALFIAGVALLMLSANSLALYRSKVPRQLQGAAGAKSLWFVVCGVGLTITGLVLFVMRAFSTR